MHQVASNLISEARALRPQILAEREHIETLRRLPEELSTKLARAGFFCIFLPKSYGGLDLNPLEAMEIYEELAYADASVAWCTWNANAHWTIAQVQEATAKEIFANPHIFVANSTRPTGQARVVDGGYEVSGRWSLVSGCQLSSWVILMCSVIEKDQPRLNAAGQANYRFMICPTSSCQIIDTWTVSGLRGTGSNDVVVENLFVPKAFSSFFTDPPVLTGQRYRLPPFTRVIPGLGMISLGIARSAIDTLVGLATEKRHERSSQALSEDRGAQTRLAQAESLVESARLYLLDTVSQMWDYVLAGNELTIQQRAKARLATSHAVTSAVQAVDLIYLTGGATSLYTSCPIERAFRDVHATTQHIAVHPRVLEGVGRLLFGVEPDALTPNL